MSLVRGLHKAKQQKNDDFYTQLPDIENELKHYKQHFAGKVVYCNCDDPKISNFYKYFSLNFEALGLKKLITTCYKNQSQDLFSDHASEKAIWLECEQGTYENGAYVPSDPIVRHLNGDGDFRSPECVELLKQTDIVVTNPPFSLFREYVAQLIDNDKKFVIIGNKNAITYKEIFRLIKDNLLWVGNTPMGKDLLFDVPEHYADELLTHKKEGSSYRVVDGVVKARSQSIWLTNLDHAKRHEELFCYKRYLLEEYPKYHNYNAINVDKTLDIPKGYHGFMGVPISFLDKYNPDQIEIIGLGIANHGKAIGVRPYTPEHRKYRKEVQKRGTVDGDLYMIKDGVVTVPYARVLIKMRG